MDSLQSKVKIANAALGKIGVAVITSLDPPDSNSRGAIRVSQVYSELRDYVLSQHSWTFAKKTTALAVLAITPPVFGDGVTLAYAYPADWIKPNKWNSNNAIIRMESDAIYSDTAGLLVKYTFQNDNPATYSPEFIETLATKIAAEVCYDLTNNAQKASELQAEYVGKLAQAIAADSQGDTPEQAIQDEWLNARLSGAQTTIPLPGQVSFN